MIIKDNMANMCAKVTSTYMEFTLAFGPKLEFSFSFKGTDMCSLKKFEDARYCMIFPKGNSSHHLERMGEFLQTVVKQKIFNIANTYGYEIIAIETDKDHIHFLLSYDTTDKVCDIVKIVKQETTYHL